MQINLTVKWKIPYVNMEQESWDRQKTKGSCEEKTVKTTIKTKENSAL